MLRKNKIRLIIFPGYFIPHIGGVETHMDELSKYLTRTKNYNITIFAPNIPISKEKETRHGSVKIIRYPAFELIPNWSLPKLWSLKFWSLYFSLYNKNFDIVMTRTRFFASSFMGLFFAKFRFSPIKFIHAEHGSSYVKVESKLTNNLAFMYDRVIGYLVINIANRVVSVSDASKKFLKREFMKKKEVTVIKRGVDFEIYNVKEKKELRDKFEGKVIIGTLCRLYKWKGIYNVITAYKNLPKKIRDKCVYLVVGGGEDYERLQKHAGKYLNNGIYFYGDVEFSDAIKYFKTFDIFVHSSYPGGGLSNSVLQAMYCDCAIVSSPNEGAREVIFDNDTGILMPDNKPENIIKGISKYVQNPKLRTKHSKNAKDYIKKNFSWSSVVEKYEKLFNEVIREWRCFFS